MSFVFPTSQLSLTAALKKLADQHLINTDTELEEGDDKVEWYLGQLYEDLSEAGYSETKVHADRRSLRAFGRVFNVVPADEAMVKSAVGYRRKAFFQFLYANVLTNVLSVLPEYAAALKEARANSLLKAKGPFYDDQSILVMAHLNDLGYEYQTEVGDLPDTWDEFGEIYLNHLYHEFKGLKEIKEEKDLSLVKLASIIRVADTDVLVAKLQKLGLKTEAELTLAVATAIVGSLRVDRRFVYGLDLAQPEDAE